MSAEVEAQRPTQPPEPEPQPTEPQLPVPAATVVPVIWDPDHELEIDRRTERRLLRREIAVLVVVAGLILLRLFLVHGS